MEKLIDLHIHSKCSDGTMTPEKILIEAIRKGIDILSITDHNTTAGSKELLRLSTSAPVTVIAGVEIDAEFNGVSFHVLGYGIDVENQALLELCAKNTALLESYNSSFIKSLMEQYDGISLVEYDEYVFQPEKGGWKALQYVESKGLAEGLTGVLELYSKMGFNCSQISFATIKAVSAVIHSAGGKVVLAHPGRNITTRNKEEFFNTIEQIIKLGIDGLECYHPSHCTEVSQWCVEICEKHHLLMTAGSDFHGEWRQKWAIRGIVKMNLHRLDYLTPYTPILRMSTRLLITGGGSLLAAKSI